MTSRKKNGKSVKDRAFIWFGQGAGIIVPALSFFSSYAPPILPVTSLLSAIGAGVVIAAYRYTPRTTRRVAKTKGPKPKHPPKPRFPSGIKTAFGCIGMALILLIFYFILFDLSTVIDPQGRNLRLQIGFGLADWSLTPLGHSWAMKYPSWGPTDLLLAEGAFSTEGTKRLWKTWTINLAGSLLAVSYFLAFILWSFAFGLLSRDPLSTTKGQSSEKPEPPDRNQR